MCLRRFTRWGRSTLQWRLVALRSAGSTCIRTRGNAPAPTRREESTAFIRTCFLNFNGKYDDMSTLPMNSGTRCTAILPMRRSRIRHRSIRFLLQEVASTFNEALLLDHMLKSIDDDSVRLALLGNYLDGLKATVFRQTQFAEYELPDPRDRRARRIAHGRPVEPSAMAGSPGSTTVRRRQCGIVDDDIGVEWASVPHFYYNFYVYQYATSFTASAAFSEEVLGGAAGARNAISISCGPEALITQWLSCGRRGST